MARRKHLPVLVAGKRYEGWIGFSDGEPHAWPANGGDGALCVQVFFSRSDARMQYEDVRPVIIEEQKRLR